MAIPVLGVVHEPQQFVAVRFDALAISGGQKLTGANRQVVALPPDLAAAGLELPQQPQGAE